MKSCPIALHNIYPGNQKHQMQYSWAMLSATPLCGAATFFYTFLVLCEKTFILMAWLTCCFCDILDQGSQL